MKMAMEQCSALLQLVRDASSDAHSSKPSESELVDKLDDVRKQLHSAGSAEIPPESAAVAICQVTSQVLAFLVVQRPVAAREATSKWHKRVFMLEMAVASAWAGLGSSGGGDLGLELTERGDVCSTYKRLLQLLWEAFQESQQAYNAVAVMTNTAVLLAIGWLSYDRVGKLMKAEELLNVCSDFCLSHESTKKLVKWPLFLLGMAHVVQKQQHARALRCFRVVVEECDAVEDDGVFFYWYALVLLHNGRSGEAVAALDKCIRANFQPVACLSLQALVSVEALDYHAAAERLQRALHIDFSHANSLCNYALLMEQMGNFEAQEQLLEYVLESPGGGDTGHSADTQRKQPGEATNVVSTGASSTSLFDTTSSHSLLPSKLTKVDVSMVHLKLAEAAMENGRWQESKKQFEEFLDRGDLCKPLTTTIEATKDYIYVLLQCKLPSSALSRCERCLLEHKRDHTAGVDSVTAALLMINLYKADALLCMERVAECCQYLSQTVRPKIQDVMQRPSSTGTGDAVTQEIVDCHTQLLNNLAVVTACSSDIDAGISILREGLQQYPDYLAVKFNLVLLLWRKGEQSTACSLWIKARAWHLQAEANGLDSQRVVSTDVVAASTNTAVFPSASHVISEHVQDSADGEGGVSAQQLAHLDALVLNYARKIKDSQLVDKSLELVELLERFAPSNIPRLK